MEVDNKAGYVFGCGYFVIDMSLPEQVVKQDKGIAVCMYGTVRIWIAASLFLGVVCVFVCELWKLIITFWLPSVQLSCKTFSGVNCLLFKYMLFVVYLFQLLN